MPYERTLGVNLLLLSASVRLPEEWKTGEAQPG